MVNEPASVAPSTVRLDIWLWQARFFKTRYLAARAINGGKVRLQRVGDPVRVLKTHFKVRIGDKITFTVTDRPLFVEVVKIGKRRGPASEAEGLYVVLAAGDDVAAAEGLTTGRSRG